MYLSESFSPGRSARHTVEYFRNFLEIFGGACCSFGSVSLTDLHFTNTMLSFDLFLHKETVACLQAFAFFIVSLVLSSAQKIQPPLSFCLRLRLHTAPSHSDAWLYIWPLWRQPCSWRILLESICPACAKPLINNLQAINCWGCWEPV